MCNLIQDTKSQNSSILNGAKKCFLVIPILYDWLCKVFYCGDFPQSSLEFNSKSCFYSYQLIESWGIPVFRSSRKVSQWNINNTNCVRRIWRKSNRILFTLALYPLYHQLDCSSELPPSSFAEHGGWTPLVECGSSLTWTTATSGTGHTLLGSV